MTDTQHQTIVDFKTDAWQSPQMVGNYLRSTEGRPVETTSFNFMSDIYLSQIPPGSRVLDVGCGTGRLTKALYDHGCEVVGSDVSDAMLDVIRQRHPEIEVRCADGHALPAEDGEFDFVTSMDFMPHFPDWAELLVEQSRVCARGGSVLFNFGNREHRLLAEHSATYHHADIYSADADAAPEVFLAEYDGDEIHAACERAGLRAVQFFPYGFFWNHYNFMIGHSIGPDRLREYNARMREFMDHDEIREFMFWMEKHMIRHLPTSMTHEHVVRCRKV